MEEGKRKPDIRSMTLIGVMAAVMCGLGPLTLPVGPVPLSLATLVIYLTVYILGGKKGTVCCLVYLAIGLAGVPVFSGFTGGIGKLLGPTGGYLPGYVFLAGIFGWFRDRTEGKQAACIIGMILGTVACYGFGTLWLAYSSHITFPAALAVGVLPFIVGDLIKIIVAAILGPQIRRKLGQAGIRGNFS